MPSRGPADGDQERPGRPWRLRISPRNVPVTRVAPPARLGSTRHRAIALLGTVSDEKVAHRSRRTIGAVRQKREELDIPKWYSNRWLPEHVALLGTLPDEEVGRWER